MITIVTDNNEILALKTFRSAKMLEEDGKYKLSVKAIPNGSKTGMTNDYTVATYDKNDEAEAALRDFLEGIKQDNWDAKAFKERYNFELLSENSQVVERLTRILESDLYDYLEYDRDGSKDKDFIQVKIVNIDVVPEIQEVGNICRELERMTGIKLYVRLFGNTGFHPTEWTHFRLKEDRDR